MLTDKELALTAKLGSCMNEFAEIADSSGLLLEDKEEFCLYIHALQNMVMAQSARRQHPGDFR